MTETALILAGLAAIHLVAVVSPGPSFVVIARSAVARSRATALWMAFGLGIGTVIWAAAAWFGLSLLFAVAPWLYAALKLAGALFLIWIALQMWRHAAAPLDISAPGAPGPGPLGAVRQGVAVQLANPKVAIFFGSIFIGLVPPDAGWALLSAVFAVVFINEFGWYALVTLFFSTPRVRSGYARLKTVIDRVCGGALGLLGLRLATS